MGDPKKHRKKYSTPNHPWQKVRIDEEKQLIKEYGFKNKNEIWKMVSFLRDATTQAKRLVALTGPQVEKEKELLLTRLKRFGLLSADAGFDKILSITLRDVLERRLQTRVYKKKLANSVKQSRQFITHAHVCIGDKVITAPSYIVPLSEEEQISFKDNSSMADAEHPERVAALAEKKAKPVISEDTGKFRDGRRRPSRRPLRPRK